MSRNTYVHGYTDNELKRLRDQAMTLGETLHNGVRYPDGDWVLEVGCGVGAQTVSLAANSPGARFTCIDISPDSLDGAMGAVRKGGFKNVHLMKANLFDRPFAPNSFDHIFCCFVLEHLPNPEQALKEMARLVRPGGTITIIEGDHGSTFFHPHSEKAWMTIQCLIDLQANLGGDSLIGRRLYPLLKSAGLHGVNVEPLFIYADASMPHMVEGFTMNTYVAMVKGVEEKAVAAGMCTREAFRAGIADMERAAAEDGTFCYTFFKATATT